MTDTGRELVSYEHDVPAIADDNLVAIAKAAEARVDAMNRIKRAALRVTNAHDWTDQGGRPYIWASGAEKIARLFGISWRIDEPRITVEEDGHYSYTFKGYFRMGAVEIEVEGSRSSKDAFFSRKKGEDIPPSEIDRNNVRKAALTNCLGNGVTRLLGIRNLSWEDLEATGIKREDISKVEYKQDEMSEEAVGQQDEIRRMILEMAEGNNKKAQDMLFEITSFTNKKGEKVAGKRTVDKLSEKAIPVTYAQVKKKHDEWCKQKPAKTSDPEADKIVDSFINETEGGKSGQQTIS